MKEECIKDQTLHPDYEKIREFVDAFDFYGVEMVNARKCYEDEFGKQIGKNTLYIKIPWGCAYTDYYRVSFESMKIILQLIGTLPPIQNMIAKRLEQRLNSMSEAMEKAWSKSSQEEP